MEQRVVDAVLAVASFTNGPILGVFFLGVLTKRVGPRGALTGIIIGISAMLFVWLRTQVVWQWYVLIGSMITFATGFLSSLLLDPKPVVQPGEGVAGDAKAA